MNNYRTQDRPNPIWVIWGRRNNYFAKAKKTFMGRDALAVLLSEVKPKRVLVPAYNCSEVFYEFRKKQCEIVYYDINADFTIDCANLIEIIKRDKIDLFYNIVYFGLRSLNINVNQTIKTHFPNIYIIEDRAHYLSNVIDFTTCDAIIYSFRKLLPIAEGGGFVAKQCFSPNFSRRFAANILPFFMYLKKIIVGYNDSYNRTSLTKNIKHVNIMPISWLSKNIINRYNYAKEIAFRKQCYKDWLIKLGKTNIKPVFEMIDDHDIPQGCPIYIKYPEKLQLFMQQNRYYLRRHWKLEDDISEIAPVSYSISNKIITLPIYQGITDNIQNEIIDLLMKYENNF